MNTRMRRLYGATILCGLLASPSFGQVVVTPVPETDTAFIAATGQRPTIGNIAHYYLNPAFTALTAPSAALRPSSNLSDLTSASAARSNLGLGSVAILNALGSANLVAGTAVANLGFTPLNPANSLSDVASPATARSNLAVIPHVATNAALLAFASYTTPVTRDFYSVAGDKGGATFYHSGTACSSADNGNQVTAADGGCWINEALELTPEMYGGGNSASGATNVAAFNAALATGKSVVCDGNYTITDRLIGARNGALGGKTRNRESCTFAIDAATFNMSAAGVIQMCPQGGIEPGMRLHDTTITFVQPDTATKASLNAYPPAIMSDTDLVYPSTGSACARWRIENVKIAKAWDGFNMRGNSGGVNMDGLELSAFNIGFRVDGALDIIRINDLHWWPFGGLSGSPMTSNQSTVFRASSTAFELGRADGVYCNDCVMLGGLGVNYITSVRSTGPAWFGMQGGGFDTNTGVSMLVDGTFQGSNIYFSPTLSTDYAINQSNGAIRISNASVFAVFAAANAPIRVSGGVFEMSNTWLASQGIDKSLYSQTGGTSILSGNWFVRNNNTTYSNATINKTAGRLTAFGNRSDDKGTGTGNFIRVTTDEWDRVVYNMGVGWTNSFPTAVNGVYSPN